MATVKLSGDLRQRILNALRDPFARRALGIREKIERDLSEPIYNDLFGDEYCKHVQQADRILQTRDKAYGLTDKPAADLIQTSSTTLNVKIVYLGPEEEKVTFFCRLKFTKPKPVPMAYVLTYSYTASSRYAILRLDKRNTAYKDKLIDQIMSYEKVILEGQNLYDSCEKLLKECNSLKQVMEVWPSVLDFVPEETRIKHFNKPKRLQTRTKLELEDFFEVGTVKAQMLKSIQGDDDESV